jgi:hypothetical protein
LSCVKLSYKLSVVNAVEYIQFTKKLSNNASEFFVVDDSIS